MFVNKCDTNIAIFDIRSGAGFDVVVFDVASAASAASAAVVTKNLSIRHKNCDKIAIFL